MGKEHFNTKVLSSLLAVLLISSAIVILATSSVATVNAENSIPTDAYGDPNQEKYAYPIGPGGNSANQFFNPGPGPDTPTIKWTRTSADLGLTGTLAGAPCIAVGGKIITWTSGTTSGWVAIDAQTGALVWNKTAGFQGTPGGFGTSTIFQVDETHFGETTGAGVYIYSLLDGSRTGSYAVNGTVGLGNFGGGSVIYWRGFWDSYDKLKLETSASIPGNYTDPDTGRVLMATTHVAVAIDCSNPAAPYLKWTRPLPTGIEVLGSAPGICYFGGYGEGQIWALNATNGKIIWTAFKGGNAGYIGNYYEGRFYHSASSTTLTCWNATTGEVLFDQNEGARAFFVFGDTLAYGMYIGKNIALPDSYVGAWDAYTGMPLWKTPALYNIAYLVPVVADGKMYIQQYQGTAGGEQAAGNAFSCFDVFTGERIWTLPGVSWATPIIAYGNLYAVSGGTVYCLGDTSSNTEPKAYPQFHYSTDPNNYGGVLTGQPAPQSLEVLYKATLPAAASITGSVVADAGKVFFGAYDGNIYCYDANSPTQIWKFQTGYRIGSTPAIYNGIVITGADDGNIYGLNENTGQQIWKTPAGGYTQILVTPAWQGRSSPQLDNAGNVFVGSLDGNLYCLNALTGAVKWAKPAGNATFPICGTPLVVNNTYVYVSSLDTNLYAFRISDGAQMWVTKLQTATRAQMSSMVYDRGCIWIGVGTVAVDRINATDGVIYNVIRLPYSQGTGSMTPAICAPAVWHSGSNYYLFIGDGFQEDCFNISNFRYGYNGTDGANSKASAGTASIMVNSTFTGAVNTYNGIYYRDATRGNRYFAANASFQNVEFQNMTTGATWTLTNGTVLSGTVYVNETQAPLVWTRWLGHQIYSGSLYVNDLQGPKMYLGDDVFSITVINATATPSQNAGGAGAGSTFDSVETLGPVFGGPCIYNDTVYFGSQDGSLWAFRDPVIKADFTIYAAPSKTEIMWNNETLTVAGRLWATPKLRTNFLGEQTNLGIYDSARLANTTVTVQFVKPDGSNVAVDVQTDNDGKFIASYNPTETGEYSWIAFYNGQDKGFIQYGQAFTEYNTLDVVAAPSSEPVVTPTPTPTETVAPTETPVQTASPDVTATPTATATTDGGFPIEYVYAIVAVIVIVVIAVAAYMYMQKGKKQ